MKITISGNPGSGKSTIAKMLAEKYKLERYSAGQFTRELAEKRGMSILELSKEAEKDPAIDKKIDEMTKKLRNKDDLVIDGRIAFYFIPTSLKIFLKVDLDISAERIYRAKRPEEKEDTGLEETKNAIIKRETAEKNRYKKYYKIDYTSEKNYDLVVDTNNKSPEEVFEEVTKYIDNNKL